MFNTDDWTIFRPIIAVLIDLGGLTAEDAKWAVKDFLDLSQDDTTPLQLILEKFLLMYEELVEEAIAKGKEDQSISVTGAQVRGIIAEAYKGGLIAGQRLTDYKPEMEARGWRLRRNKKGEVSWVYGI